MIEKYIKRIDRHIRVMCSSLVQNTVTIIVYISEREAPIY